MDFRCIAGSIEIVSHASMLVQVSPVRVGVYVNCVGCVEISANFQQVRRYRFKCKRLRGLAHSYPVMTAVLLDSRLPVWRSSKSSLEQGWHWFCQKKLISRFFTPRRDENPAISKDFYYSLSTHRIIAWNDLVGHLANLLSATFLND